MKKTLQKAYLKISSIEFKLFGIRPDLIKHFIVCFIFPLLFGSHGASFALGLGVGKEYGDSACPNNKWDWWDILADVLGIAFGLILHYFLLFLIIFCLIV
jgi:hypothetical protein